MRARATALQEHQRSLYATVYEALRLYSDVPVRDSADEYSAFTEGFADFETIADIVRPPKPYDIQLAVGRTSMQLIDPGQFVAFEFSRRFSQWPQHRPHTFDAIIAMGQRRGDTNMTRLQMRRAGAQLAFELQRPYLDVA